MGDGWDDEDEDGFIADLRKNLRRLILYASSADATLQREVAERLANEAIEPARQSQIVELGGLELLLPLTESSSTEVQRLAAHALANLAVNPENQRLMGERGGIEMLVALLDHSSAAVLQQAAKALANIGVCASNKRAIAQRGGLRGLIALAAHESLAVRIEAIAALANLAVNDENESDIVDLGGIDAVCATARETSDAELRAQCARAAEPQRQPGEQGVAARGGRSRAARGALRVARRAHLVAVGASPRQSRRVVCRQIEVLAIIVCT